MILKMRVEVCRHKPRGIATEVVADVDLFSSQQIRRRRQQFDLRENQNPMSFCFLLSKKIRKAKKPI
jgi:hypothetical protein